jgi:hypothetical protein
MMKFMMFTSSFMIVTACMSPKEVMFTPPITPNPIAAEAAAPAAPKENLSPAQLKAMQSKTFEGISKESLMKVVENVATDRKYITTAGSSGADRLVMHYQENGASPTDVVFHRMTASFDPISDKIVELRLILTKDYFQKDNNNALVTGETQTAAYHKEFFDAVRVEIERRKAMGRK